MRNQHFDLVKVIPEIEAENRIAVQVLTDAEIEFLMEESRNMPEGIWDGEERRKPLQEQQS